LNLLLYCYFKINSDGQQVAQYQQNKQSPHTLADCTQKKTMTYDVGNPVPGLGQANYVGIRKIFVQISFVLGNIRKTRGISQNVWSSS
jgi:Na+/serine symporter